MFAVIEGGQRPRGVVRVSGAKNSATRLLAAALLTDQVVELLEFPTRLVDVDHKVKMISKLGGCVELDHKGNKAVVSAANLRAVELDNYDCPIRTTYLLVAGQLLRSGIARIPYPGGCKIGSRGYDMHVMVWECFGCEVIERGTHIEVRGRKLKPAAIRFPISTVGGTENALICAAIVDGSSEITNAYVTPEVEDLIALLRAMGARIDLAGNSHIRIHGSQNLTGARMQVMPDRIEAITWIVYAVLAGGSVLIERVPFDAMRSPLLYLESAGVDVLRNSTSVYIHPDCLTRGGVQPFEVPCGAHPGVISDMQPFFVMLALAASGTSRIYDYRYPERIAYASELAKFLMPGTLCTEVGKITVQGPGSFRPATATSTDLRGSMAMILAALCAPGKSLVRDAHVALRGYNDLEGKLIAIGVNSLKIHAAAEAAPVFV